MSWERWTNSSSVSAMLSELRELLNTRSSPEPLVLRETIDMLGVPVTNHAIILAFPGTEAQYSFSVSSGGITSGTSGSWPTMPGVLTSATSSPAASGRATMFTGTIDLSTMLPLRLLASLIESMKSWKEDENPRLTPGVSPDADDAMTA